MSEAGLAKSICYRCLGDRASSPSKARHKVGNGSDESPIFVSEIQGHSGPPLLGRTKATLKPEIRLSNTDRFGEERFGVESDRTWQLNLSSVGRVFELRRSHHNGALTTCLSKRILFYRYEAVACCLNGQQI